MKTLLSRLVLVIAGFTILGLMASCQPPDTEPTSTAAMSAQAPPTLPALTKTPEAADTPEPTQTPLQPAEPTQTPGLNDAGIRTTIINALLALYTRPNRMIVTTELDDGTMTTSVIEFIPPAKKHIAAVEEKVDYIVVGDKVYVKTEASDTWEETQIPATAFLGDAEVTAETIGQTISDAQWVRDDVFDKRAVVVLSYDSTTRSGDVELRSRTELWVDEDDGLPYKMVVDGQVLSAATDPDAGEGNLQPVQALTTILVEFDSTIDIQVP